MEESHYMFSYMMLGRMQSDCEYFLGFGNRSTSRLSGENVSDHIEDMKELYNSFPQGLKPQWLTFEDILRYEKQMATVE